MQSVLIIGIIICVGFVFGELAKKAMLPKVTGYIVAGILLNPEIAHFVPRDFASHTDPVTNIALSIITFSVGGSLFYPRIKELGKDILYITVFEAEMAFAAVAMGLVAVYAFFPRLLPCGLAAGCLMPFGLLMAALGSPTDPSATLAVMHEYKAKGPVASVIIGVAATDDAFGIMNYSVAAAVSGALLAHNAFSAYGMFLQPLVIIIGSVALGALVGAVFNVVTSFVNRESGGVFIVLVFGLLSLCFGLATILDCDQLLATMTAGVIVVNFNAKKEAIFSMLAEYAEEIIFVLFFTLSGMHLDFAILLRSMPLVLLFVVLRAVGKIAGTLTGSALAAAPPAVRRYTAAGLIPQGGIVIGLALMIKQDPALSGLGDLILSITIGATAIHELIGPILAKETLRRAGEIAQNRA